MGSLAEQPANLDDLVSELTTLVVETALEEEMAERLGYEKHEEG